MRTISSTWRAIMRHLPARNSYLQRRSAWVSRKSLPRTASGYVRSYSVSACTLSRKYRKLGDAFRVTSMCGAMCSAHEAFSLPIACHPSRAKALCAATVQCVRKPFPGSAYGIVAVTLKHICVGPGIGGYDCAIIAKQPSLTLLDSNAEPCLRPRLARCQDLHQLATKLSQAPTVKVTYHNHGCPVFYRIVHESPSVST